MNHIFYFLLTLTAGFAAAKDSDKAVFDSYGRIISNGTYHVMPRYYSEHGGGLTLAPRDGNQCPLYVGQEDSYFSRGIPIRFTDWRYEDGFVSESENLNIEMDTNVTICSQSNDWRITPADVVPARLFIKSGPKPSSGLFQIKRSDLYKSMYQIFFCPDGYDCTKVGIFMDKNGVRRLALNSTSIEFSFDATGKKTSSN